MFQHVVTTAGKACIQVFTRMVQNHWWAKFVWHWHGSRMLLWWRLSYRTSVTGSLGYQRQRCHRYTIPVSHFQCCRAAFWLRELMCCWHLQAGLLQCLHSETKHPSCCPGLWYWISQSLTKITITQTLQALSHSPGLWYWISQSLTDAEHKLQTFYSFLI